VTTGNHHYIYIYIYILKNKQLKKSLSPPTSSRSENVKNAVSQNWMTSTHNLDGTIKKFYTLDGKIKTFHTTMLLEANTGRYK